MSSILNSANKELMEYGIKKQIRLGTTASVLLIQNDKYYVAHVGDSRVYHFSSILQQVTEEDSVAAEKVRRGEITQLEYENSREQHILTQCVGVNASLNIHFYAGNVAAEDVFFLCCDGMYHHLAYDELKAVMITQRRERGVAISTAIERLIDRIISRGEKDNITGAIICCI